jgi:hypothetical protein
MGDDDRDTGAGRRPMSPRDAGEPNPSQDAASRAGQDRGPGTAPSGTEHLTAGLDSSLAPPGPDAPDREAWSTEDPGTAGHDQPAEGGRDEVEEDDSA